MHQQKILAKKTTKKVDKNGYKYIINGRYVKRGKMREKDGRKRKTQPFV